MIINPIQKTTPSITTMVIETDDSECTICMEKHNNKLTTLKCKHKLHTPCYDKLAMHKQTIKCPICRKKHYTGDVMLYTPDEEDEPSCCVLYSTNRPRFIVTCMFMCSVLLFAFTFIAWMFAVPINSANQLYEYDLNVVETSVQIYNVTIQPINEYNVSLSYTYRHFPNDNARFKYDSPPYFVHIVFSSEYEMFEYIGQNYIYNNTRHKAYVDMRNPSVIYTAKPPMRTAPYNKYVFILAITLTTLSTLMCIMLGVVVVQKNAIFRHMVIQQENNEDPNDVV